MHAAAFFFCVVCEVVFPPVLIFDSSITHKTDVTKPVLD